MSLIENPGRDYKTTAVHVREVDIYHILQTLESYTKASENGEIINRLNGMLPTEPSLGHGGDSQVISTIDAFSYRPPTEEIESYSHMMEAAAQTKHAPCSSVTPEQRQKLLSLSTNFSYDDEE